MSKEPRRIEAPVDLDRLASATHDDPFAWLGRHLDGDEATLRCFLPGTRSVRVISGPVLQRYGESDLFLWHGPAGELPPQYAHSWIG